MVSPRFEFVSLERLTDSLNTLCRFCRKSTRLELFIESRSPMIRLWLEQTRIELNQQQCPTTTTTTTTTTNSNNHIQTSLPYMHTTAYNHVPAFSSAARRCRPNMEVANARDRPRGYHKRNISSRCQTGHSTS